jgi:hypothetical protein
VNPVMNTGEPARGGGAGQKGPPTAQPVSGPPRNEVHPRSGVEGGVVASADSVRTWEGVYRHYGRAWEWTARSPKGDPAAAREMASASWAVAAAWRQIAATTTLPWWTLAAIESAAGAFEAQARSWEARDTSESGL